MWADLPAWSFVCIASLVGLVVNPCIHFCKSKQEVLTEYWEEEISFFFAFGGSGDISGQIQMDMSDPRSDYKLVNWLSVDFKILLISFKALIGLAQKYIDLQLLSNPLLKYIFYKKSWILNTWYVSLDFTFLSLQFNILISF